MKSVAIFNTASSSLNLGDQIIMEAVNREIENAIDDDTFLFDVSTHAGYNHRYNKILKNTNFSFLGGTNILSSRFNLLPWKNQLCVGLINARYIHDVILLGTGWGSQQKTLTPSAHKFYNKVLSKRAVHSVRDSMSLKKIKSIGISNVVNTGCPTLWNLTKEKCNTIPSNKSDAVVTTITDYLRDEQKDMLMLETLVTEYKKVYLWIQGSEDYSYFSGFPSHLVEKINLIPPRLHSYDKFLDTNDVDFVGTRLHAGIRAMQKGKRTLIISIDNRAREMGADFNINILERSEITNLKSIIHSELLTDIKLATNEINLWRKQFQ